jgi:hypothetical protein
LKAAALLMLVLAAAGCRQDMHDQPKVQPYEASDFFADGRGSRPPVEGAVARGQLHDDQLFHTGMDGDAFAARFPFPVTHEVLGRGRERYDIYCSPCHDRVGNGNGIVVQRGFKHPPSFHDPRLRESAPGYFFSVMTNGFGVMASYAAQVPAHDRWAIAAYLRALQLSQHAVLAEWPLDVRATLTDGLAAVPPAADAATEAAAEAGATDHE